MGLMLVLIHALKLMAALVGPVCVVGIEWATAGAMLPRTFPEP